MKIKYDQQADAMYIRLNDGVFAVNKEVDNDVILDIGKNNVLLGIEILNVSEKIPPEAMSHIDIQLGMPPKLAVA